MGCPHFVPPVLHPPDSDLKTGLSAFSYASAQAERAGVSFVAPGRLKEGHGVSLFLSERRGFQQMLSSDVRLHHQVYR